MALIHCCLGYTAVNRMLQSKFIFRNVLHMADSSRESIKKINHRLHGLHR
jgi:hypothetical protein